MTWIAWQPLQQAHIFIDAIIHGDIFICFK